MWNGIIAKTVGSRYEVECNKSTNTVTIINNGKQKQVYNFPKMYLAINFYAKLKKVKDIKEADLLYQYQSQV